MWREVSSQCTDPLIYKLNDIQQLIKNCTTEIAKHDREIANLNAKYDRDIRNLTAKQENCTTEMANLNAKIAKHDREIANLNAKYDRGIANLTDELEKQVCYRNYILG